MLQDWFNFNSGEVSHKNTVAPKPGELEIELGIIWRANQYSLNEGDYLLKEHWIISNFSVPHRLRRIACK